MELYRRYNRMVFGASMRILKDPHLSEDTMHDAFIRAFSRIGELDEPAAFGGWLRRMAVNASLNLLKRQGLERVKNEEYSVEETTPEEHDDEQLELKVDQVKRAIANLPDGYRVILSLYLLEGYDHEEIGEVLGVTASTSRSQYSRALKKLRSILKNRDDERQGF